MKNGKRVIGAGRGAALCERLRLDAASGELTQRGFLPGPGGGTGVRSIKIALCDKGCL